MYMWHSGDYNVKLDYDQLQEHQLQTEGGD